MLCNLKVLDGVDIKNDYCGSFCRHCCEDYFFRLKSVTAAALRIRNWIFCRVPNVYRWYGIEIYEINFVWKSSISYGTKWRLQFQLAGFLRHLHSVLLTFFHFKSWTFPMCCTCQKGFKLTFSIHSVGSHKLKQLCCSKLFCKIWLVICGFLLECSLFFFQTASVGLTVG